MLLEPNLGLYSWARSSFSESLGDLSDSPTNHSLSSNHGVDGNDSLRYLWLVLGITIYITGLVFVLVWIYTRDYGGQAYPWVPSFFRTEACCVILEPLVRIWPAILWPWALILLFGYLTFDKAMHATTCCGREVTRSKRAKRWNLAAPRTLSSDGIELVSPTTGTMTPDSARTLSVGTELVRTPPPMYRTRLHSVADFLPQAKANPSRANSDPFPRPLGSCLTSSSRAKSISDSAPGARGSPRKLSCLSVSTQAESQESLVCVHVCGRASDVEAQQSTRCGKQNEVGMNEGMSGCVQQRD